MMTDHDMDEIKKEEKRFDNHDRFYGVLPNQIEIRIYNYDEYDETRERYKGNAELLAEFDEECESSYQHYHRWLYRQEFKQSLLSSHQSKYYLRDTYQLKAVVPHPKEKNSLIHYYERMPPYVDKNDINRFKDKALLSLFIGVPSLFLGWWLLNLPWLTIFGFIFLTIKDIAM